MNTNPNDQHYSDKCNLTLRISRILFFLILCCSDILYAEGKLRQNLIMHIYIHYIW